MRPWEVLVRRLAFSAHPYFEVFRETVKLPDGRVIDDYHQITGGKYAIAVAENEQGQILLLRQYRHGVRRVGYSLPGGRIEDGESGLQAAQREFLEETGYTAKQWRPLGGYDLSCTYGLGRNDHFHAAGLEYIKAPHSDDLEETTVGFFDRQQVLDAILNEEMVSAGHALALSLYFLNRADVRALASR